MTQQNIRKPFALLGSEGALASWWRGIKWRNILIGDLNRIDVGALVFGRAMDIILCGVGAAFILLIAFAAMAFPNDLRAIVWIGCAFLLVTVVDGPSWDWKLSFPLIVIIIGTGSVTLASVVVGFPREWIMPNNLNVFGPLYGVALGILCAEYLFVFEVQTLSSAFRRTPQEKEADSERKIVAKVLGTRCFVRKVDADGSIQIMTWDRKFPIDDHLEDVKLLLQRDIAVTRSRRGRPVLVIQPMGVRIDGDH